MMGINKAECSPELCVSCPKRTDPLRKVAAVLALGPFYKPAECKTGPVVSKRFMDISQRYNMMDRDIFGTSAAGPIVTVEQVCGRDVSDLPAELLHDLAVDTTLLNGKVISRVSHGSQVPLPLPDDNVPLI